MNETSTAPLVEHDPSANVTDLLLDRVAATPHLPLFAVPAGDGWQDVTAAEFHRSVVALAKGFIAAGLGPGDRIGIVCRVRYEWTLVDFAAAFAGLVLVPVYETSSPSQVRHVLSSSGARALVAEDDELASSFDAVAHELPDVGVVWRMSAGDLDAPGVAGRAVTADELEARRTLARSTDVATIIYTSGSTGSPKGCVITHANLVDLSRNTAAALAEVIRPGASTLLFVTTAHVFARFVSIMCVHGGVRVGHEADTTRLLPSLASFRPTFFLAVPRVFEKVFNSARQQAEAGGKGRVFDAATDTAVAYSTALDRGRVPLRLRLRFALFDALVYRRLRALFGGRVDHAVSGSAPLGERLGHFYRGLGIQVLEGYGLTETTAPTSITRPGRFRIGTVGPPLPGVDVRIADDGEVLVRGVNVFAGYWHDAAATASVFDGDWFRTGDLGSLDADGSLTITGRTKEIIVTAGGKNVAPAALEDPIRAHPIVSQVVVVGDRRPFIGALVTLDREMLPAWLRNQGVDPGLSAAEAARHPVVHAAVRDAVEAANARVSRAESIREFRILDAEFTQASGHLTPKLSIRRARILEDFGHEVDRIYAGSSSPDRQGAA